MDIGIHGIRKKPVLQTILAKDVCETRRYDGFESEVLQCPDGMFTRAAAAEVVAGNKNLGALVHLKFRTIFKQMLADADLVGHLEETRRDDLIGIDVFSRHNDDA